jgi:hypothetical protein
MALYSEHPNIPEEINFSFDAGGEFITIAASRGGLPQSASVTGELVREVEVELIMTPKVALSLVKWLQEKIEEVNQLSE